MTTTATEPSSALPLAGVTVLDLGRVIAGPFVGQILGDLGAMVIKVERQGIGDETRSYGGGERSTLFEALNRNKQSIALDLQHPDARRVLDALIERADVLVHNFRPGVMERLGLTPEGVWAVNPRVVYCAISGFGNSGPLRTKTANDVIAQAFSGLMSYTGDADGPPVRVPVPIADYTAGLYATCGVMAALVERAATGRGRVVETSLLESMMALECMHIGDYLVTGKLPLRLASGNLLGQPNQAFSTKDGSAVIAAVNDQMWQRCAEVLGGAELAGDARYRSGTDRLVRKDELAKVIGDITRQFRTDDLIGRLEGAGVACSAINSLADLTAHEHVHEVAILRGAHDPHERDMVGSPLQVDGVRPAVRSAPPSLGGDTTSVLRAAGFAPDEIAGLLSGGAVATTPPVKERA
jgi:crotonobetainyl-CoA:carnitine CoA-transferase CaiB-like acyl-CoA transferase